MRLTLGTSVEYWPGSRLDIIVGAVGQLLRMRRQGRGQRRTTAGLWFSGSVGDGAISCTTYTLSGKSSAVMAARGAWLSVSA